MEIKVLMGVPQKIYWSKIENIKNNTDIFYYFMKFEDPML